MLNVLMKQFRKAPEEGSKAILGAEKERGWSMDGPDKTQSIVNVTLLLRAAVEAIPSKKIELLCAVNPSRGLIKDMKEEFAFVRDSVECKQTDDIPIDGLTVSDVDKAETLWRDLILQDKNHGTQLKPGLEP